MTTAVAWVALAAAVLACVIAVRAHRRLDAINRSAADASRRMRAVADEIEAGD